MNYFELQALSSMTSYKPSFKEAVLRVMEQIEVTFYSVWCQMLFLIQINTTNFIKILIK